MIKYDSASKKEKLFPAIAVSKSERENKEKNLNLQRGLKGDKVHAAVKNTLKYGRH